MSSLVACENHKDSTAPPQAPQPALPASVAHPSQDPQAPTAAREVAILAGGCFWGMEGILRDVPGVLDTEVGYAGGAKAQASYEQVKTGSTDHAEAIRVVFDPSRISYSELLENWFFRMHDPTTKNRQGNDRGRQYRSAIFFQNPAQKSAAESSIARASKNWTDPIVTELTAFSTFVPAENYHQDYLDKNPGGYTCHYLRDSAL